MSLQPSLSFLTVGHHTSPHTLELYIDFVCPFCAKIFLNAVDTYLKTAFTGGKYAGRVKLLIRLQPQPWHASSTFTIEAALAVGRVSPNQFYAYAIELFKNQQLFSNRPTSTQTPAQTREQLVALVPKEVDAVQVAELLELDSKGYVAVTDDLKYNIKLGRQNGIHVTPSALWDGLLVSEVSSSWGKEEWEKFLEAKVAETPLYAKI